MLFRSTSDVDGGAGSMLLRTVDGGETWERATQGLPAEHAYMICGIQVNPRNPDQVFAAYTDGSVYQSRDGGETWAEIIEGVEKLIGLRVKA